MNELEAKVKDRIKKAIRSLWPSAWIFMPVQFGMGKNGVPDVLAIVPVEITLDMVGITYGMAVTVEAKRSKKKPTKLQYGQLAEIVRADGFAHYTAGVEEVATLERNLKTWFKL